jgi:hypothetical protein
MQSITTKINNKCLAKIGECITTTDVCEIKDSSTMYMSDPMMELQGYTENSNTVSKLLVPLYKSDAYQALGTLRYFGAREMIAKVLCNFMGDYSSIYNTLKILPGPKTKNKKAIRIELNEYNSLFMDIEAGQKSMVTLYNFTLAGVTLLPRCMLGSGGALY